MPKPNAYAEHAARVIARAVCFTAVRFLGRGRYQRQEAPTLDAARALAPGDGQTMIYAVDPEGRSVHVCNV